VELSYHGFGTEGAEGAWGAEEHLLWRKASSAAKKASLGYGICF